MKIRLLLISLLIATTARGQLVINELMQSNVDCVMDDLNDFPDSWVELYNPGSSNEDLQNYKIGLTANPDEAYQLPQQVVAVGRYVLICCDEEAKDLHTDFRLESGKGGAVYLFKNNSIVDQLTDMAKQPAPNIAYGRAQDGSSTWGYELTPTPNAANSGGVTDKILGQPVFSEGGKVFSDNRTINLTISLPEGTPENAEIRLTYDGTEPTATSPRYSSPIVFSSNRIIRARIFCDGWISPPSVTHSFIKFSRDITLPVVSIVTNNKYLNDSKIGILSDNTYSDGSKNYEHNWRRPINFEFFDQPGQESALNQLGETRVMGGASRGCQLKSMVIFANKRFGKKHLKYEFFPTQRPNSTKFKSIQLRNAGNDFDYLYMRDAIIQRTMAQNADLDWQAWSPAIVYINGTYKGILNIRERSNEKNIYTNYDGLTDIDMIESWGTLVEGTKDNFSAFQDFYAEHGHTMAEYDELMDCKEFINLMAMNLFYNNQDFPGNNIVMWRPRAEGGRWRFVAKDTDFGLGLYGSSATYKTIEWLYNPNYDGNRAWANQYQHTRLFRRLMEDADFKREFIDRCAIYMGDFMNTKGTREVWDPMYERIKTEYPYHRELVNKWWPNYTEELNNARAWLVNRVPSFYQQLADYYQLGTPTALTINQSLDDDHCQASQIDFNGVTLTKSVFDGKFFQGRAITLEGQCDNGTEAISGWSVNRVESNGSTTSFTVDGSQYTFDMPTCKSLVINAIFSASDGISTLGERSWTWTWTQDGLLLRQVAAGTRVSLCDVQGMRLAETTSNGSDIQLNAPENRVLILRVGADAIRIKR